jgi:hypothetical protein
MIQQNFSIMHCRYFKAVSYELLTIYKEEVEEDEEEENYIQFIKKK